MLLNANKKAQIVIESELRANVRFLALMNVSAIGRHFTQVNAYFLVMNIRTRRTLHPITR